MGYCDLNVEGSNPDAVASSSRMLPDTGERPVPPVRMTRADQTSGSAAAAAWQATGEDCHRSCWTYPSGSKSEPSSS